MKKFLLSVCLILTFCICAAAQAAKPAPCPKVSVETSFISVIDGYPMIFTAKITGAKISFPFKGGIPGGGVILQYKWTVSGGEILERQGTTKIKVDTLGFAGEKIKATLTVRGLPKRCKNKASATGFVKPKPYLEQEQ
jgi:hypothetical protein